MRRQIGVVARLALLTGLVVAVVAGCSSASKKTSSSSPTSSKAASGSPIVFGMFNQENAPTGSFTQMRLAVNAAVDYVNNQLGGINGHPMKVDTCITAGSPESSVACANTLIQDHPVAILGGADILMQAALPIYQHANLPVIGGAPFTPGALAAPNSYAFAGWSASWSAVGVYIGEHFKGGTKPVALMFPQNGGEPQLANSWVGGPMKALGIPSYTDVSAPETTTDWTPYLAAAYNSKPRAIVAIATPSDCLSILQANSSLGASVPLFLPDDCASPNFLKSIQTGSSGIYFLYQFLPTTASTDPQVVKFEQVIKQYGKGNIPLDDFSQAGFNEVMNAQARLSAIKTSDLTPPVIAQSFKTATNVPNYMGAPYTCGGTVVPSLPAVCNNSARIVHYRNGSFTDVGGGWVDGSKYIH